MPRCWLLFKYARSVSTASLESAAHLALDWPSPSRAGCMAIPASSPSSGTNWFGFPRTRCMARLPCFIFSRGVGMGVGFSLLAWRAYGGFCYCNTVYFLYSFVLAVCTGFGLFIAGTWVLSGALFLLAILLALLLADFTSYCVTLLSFYVLRRSGLLGRLFWWEGYIQKQWCWGRCWRARGFRRCCWSCEFWWPGACPAWWFAVC